MPTDQAPSDKNEPSGPEGPNPTGTSLVPDAPAADEELRPAKSASPTVRGSRWVDYDTHELLQLISDLEDERRWARLREGIWLAILIHAALFAAVLLLPKYVFVVPPVVDSSNKILEHKEFTYLDTPKIQPKVEIKPVPVKPPEIDKKTLEDLNKAAPPRPAPEPAPAPQQAAPPPPPSQQAQSPIEA